MKSKKEIKSVNIRIFTFAVLCLLVASAPLYALSPLHTEGNKIKDAQGHVIVLRGVCAPDIGMVNQWYGTHDYIDRLTDPNDTNGSYTGWYTKVISYAVCPNDSFVKDSPLVFNPYDDDDPNNELVYEALKDAVDYGAQKGVYSIISLCYHDKIATKVAETNAFWNYMAPKFAGDGNVLFELFAEPNDEAGTWLGVKGRMQAWVNIVRNYTSENICFVTGPCWAQQIGPAVLSNSPVIGDNIVYTMHFYANTWITNQSWVTTQIDAVSPVYPVMVNAWGYEPNNNDPNNPNEWAIGTAANFGTPMLDYIEGLGIGSMASVADWRWSCHMFDPNWQLLCGDYMGCFVKDWLYEKRNAERMATMTVTKCKITAGKTQGANSGDTANIKDAFAISGTFSNIPLDFTQTSAIEVNLVALDSNQNYYESIDCNSSRVKSGKFSYKYKILKNQPGAITSMSIDPVGRKFSLTAQNVDLTGLSSPLHLEISMGYYTLAGDINEAIINGKCVLIPTRLMRLYDDALVVTKACAKHGTKPLSDSFSAVGFLAVENNDVNLCVEDVNFIWGQQVFNVPQGSFKVSKTGHLYKCCKVIADTNDGNAGTVTASIDIDKAVFTVSVTNADSLDVTSDYIDFGVQFGDFNEIQDVNRVTKRSY